MIKIAILSLLIVGSFASMSFLGTNTCSAKGEKCGHELEGQKSCCTGLRCNYGAAIGAPGVCQQQCSVEDEACGHEFEGNQACCQGFTCTIAHPGRLGARGVCKPTTVLTLEAPQQCVTEGGVCGHEFAGNNHCCDGLTCATFGGALGGNGVCMKPTVETVVAVEAPQQCSAKGEKCGHEFEGQRSCCTGLRCNFGAAIGAPGVCQEQCSVEDEACGHEFEGNQACCQGFTCTIAHPGRLGARGVCKPTTVLTLEAPQQCVTEGGVCGHEFAGNNHCCDGLTCATFGGALGGNGVCMKPTVETVVAVEAPQQCVAEGGVCGHEFAGNNHCCDGLTCATFGGALGGNGVCMKQAPTEELYRCGTKGDSCGLGFEGGLICCQGHECIFPEDNLPGSKGVCLEKKTEKPVCASEGQVCSHEFEGTRCCEGFSCTTVADAPHGAPGVCLRNAVVALIRTTKKNVCAAEGEVCGHEREGQKNCCEGFVCYLGDVAPLGSTGVCMRQIAF